MPDRLSCCAPLCRRTRRHDPEIVAIDGVEVDLFGEWICEKHWKFVPEGLRRIHFAAKRKLRKHRTIRCAQVAGRIWRRCKKTAIERAAGI